MVATNRKWVYWAAQILGWFSYVFLIALYNLLTATFNFNLVKLLLVVFVVGTLLSHVFRTLIVRLDWLSLPSFKVIPRVLLGSLVFGTLLAVLQALFSDLFFRDIKPLLSFPFFDVLQLATTWSILFLFWSLIYFAAHYLTNYKKQEIKNLRLEAAKREIELNHLKSQLNPHFIFNAMNSIRALIEENPDQAKKSITQLSSMLRSALLLGKKNKIPLSEELALVKSFLALERIRYEERLTVNYDIEEETLNCMVPPLMLQTLVENGIKHGIAKRSKGGEIGVSAKVNEQRLVLTIHNTGEYHANDSTSSGIGIENTRERLKLLYDDEASLDIHNASEEPKVMTEIRLPKETS